MEYVDTLKINFDAGQMAILNIAMAFIMFSIALDIRLSDFRKVVEFPKSVLVGIVAQYLIFPLFTLLLIYIFRPATSIALGMVLVSACPSGNVTNFLVHRAGANLPLSVSLNALVVLTATIVTPALFAIFSPWVPDSDSLRKTFELPFDEMAKTIILLILLPLMVGMTLNARFPKWTTRFRKVLQNLALILFFAILVGALVNNRENLGNYLSHVFILVAVHNAGALGMGYLLGKLAKLPEDDAITIAFETGIHNVALGLVLIFNFFGGLGGMALIAAWWGIWDLITGFALAEYLRRRKK